MSYIHVYDCMHPNLLLYIRTHKHTHDTRTPTRAQSRTTHAHTRTHTHTHTRTHTHTHTHNSHHFPSWLRRHRSGRQGMASRYFLSHPSPPYYLFSLLPLLSTHSSLYCLFSLLPLKAPHELQVSSSPTSECTLSTRSEGLMHSNAMTIPPKYSLYYVLRPHALVAACSYSTQRRRPQHYV